MGEAMSYLEQLVAVYFGALVEETPCGLLADVHAELAAARTASERGRALAAIAHALVRESDIPCSLQRNCPN